MLTDVREIVAVKRDGGVWSREQVEALIRAISDDQMSDAQIAAMTMAIYCHGMDFDECAAMTSAMARSGRMLNLERFDLHGPIVDKHSTGGLGDIVSLILAPMLAACGLYVPMISGRALGHTGGTLDKLETIPGLDIFPAPERFEEIVAREGLAIVGQTSALVPADRRIYAVRDQTGTVASMPLIVSSILSKKVAEQLDGLIIDLKVGNGAMQTADDAAPLGNFLSGVAGALDLKCDVVYTDMNQPLAPCVGDGIEMREALAFLRGDRRAGRLQDVVLELAIELMLLTEVSHHQDDARSRLTETLDNGSAADKMQRMVSALGGPDTLLDEPERFVVPGAVRKEVHATRSGIVQGVQCQPLGTGVHHVIRKGDRRDPTVGVSDIAALHTNVAAGDVIAVVEASNSEDALRLEALVRETVVIG